LLFFNGTVHRIKCRFNKVFGGMMQIDVFNGDADGLCALLQLRLAEPADSQLVTGVKRDIALLAKVSAQQGDTVTVLDISLAKNRSAVESLLQQGVSVFYVDHHQSGELPQHPHFTALIDTSPTTCSSLLVDSYVRGQYRAWAVVGAFGDNLIAVAKQTASTLSLTTTQLQSLQQLGVCLNYNGYGSTLADLHFMPDLLYRECLAYASPLTFIENKPLIYQQLVSAYHDDLTLALAVQAEYQSDTVAVYLLPDTAWARRVSGVLSNELANQAPKLAHAVLNYNAQGGYQISIRAPLTRPTGADSFCSLFASGGGRQGAAGINHLPLNQLSTFINAFAHYYDSKKH
jgi:hypothetical protein